MSNIAELLKKVKAELSAGLPFMEGRENGSLVCDVEFTITEFGFLTDNENDRPYVSFLVREDDEHFFFGGSVVTKKLQTIKELLSEDELKALLTEGLKVKFITKKSKDKKRDYTDMELV